MKIIKLPELRRQHICSVCNKLFIWSDDCKWYGIIEDKNGNELIKYRCCSKVCKDKLNLKDED